MWIGPPKALDWPNPMSSISTMSTFGAPFGAFTSNRGGAFALRASISVIGSCFGSGIGRTERSSAGGSVLLCACSRSVSRPLAANQPKNAPMASISRDRVRLFNIG